MHARLEQLIRRLRPGANGLRATGDSLRYGDVSLDPTVYEARRGGRSLRLTVTEFRLLETFMRAPERVLSRGELYQSVWGYDFGARSNSLGVFVGYLRRKLELHGEPRLIHTVRGVGYVLRRP